MESFWTQQALMRSLYRRCLEPVCDKYRLTGFELEILLFLHHNPTLNTASQLVEIRQLSKSHVSVSLRSLEEKKYLTSAPAPNDRRVQLLTLTGKARHPLLDALQAQNRFRELMIEGFTEEEKQTLLNFTERMKENLYRFAK